MRWFTLLEILIVIMVIAILSLVSLKLNRGQIDQMRASNEREQRFARHSKYNTLLTNTNYLNGTKITSTTRTYTASNKTITIANPSTQDSTPTKKNNNNQTNTWTDPQFTFTHNTIAENFTITKTPLTLWCTINWTNNNNSNSNNNNTITIQTARNKSLCFTLNTELCTRTSATCQN